MIDTHAHIYSKQFDQDRHDALQRAFDTGMQAIYMPNVDAESIDAMLEVESKYPGKCIAMMGLHPCSVDQHVDKELYIVEDWLAKRRWAAVGEMGLDLYWDKTHIERQKEAFRIQAGWAIQYGLPLVIHTRDSMAQTIELLESLADERLYGVVHCFTGNLADATRIMAMGFKLGIGGVSTYKNGGLDQVLPHVPLSALVLETDSPYLAPLPHRGKRNEPAYTLLIAQRIAQLKNLSVPEVIAATTANAHELFAGKKVSANGH